MLSVENVDLTTAPRRPCARVSLDGRDGQGHLRHGPQRRRQDLAHARDRRPAERVAGGRILWNGEDVTALAPYERARRGIALVPQGREIFPLLTVEENLRTGFAPLERARAHHSGRRVLALPGARPRCCAGAAATSRAASSSSSPSAARSSCARSSSSSTSRPKASSPRSSRTSAAPSPICARAATWPSSWSSNISISRSELADRIFVMDRGEVVLAGDATALDEQAVRRYLTV